MSFHLHQEEEVEQEEELKEDKYCLDNMVAINIMIICFTEFMSLICFFFVDSTAFIVGIATYPQEIMILFTLFSGCSINTMELI